MSKKTNNNTDFFYSLLCAFLYYLQSQEKNKATLIFNLFSKTLIIFEHAHKLHLTGKAQSGDTEAQSRVAMGMVWVTSNRSPQSKGSGASLKC